MEELRARAGQHLGYSGWIEVTAERVAQFAAATGDHQWIHVDARRAAATRFGGPVAHGFLVLSLVSPLLAELLPRQSGGGMRVNYGCDRVRFLTPVPVGAWLRMGATLDAVRPVPGGTALELTATFLVRDQRVPACVARVLLRCYDEPLRRD